ncbi:MAG: calcineurin-like phosphoesterase C-terminal domain-containing protein [Bacteroidales bacterium]|nr:calcineurin-like phosphoesterase C-terminal domain-containing protein [Bacteroidales bacterium]
MRKRILVFFLLTLLPCWSCEKQPQGDGGGGDTPQGEWTVSGTVRGDDSNPIANVVVSDGHLCVKTDADGRYALNVDLSADLSSTLQYVFVSTPAGWAAPKEDGHAIFWKWLKDYGKNAEGKITGVDFVLTRIANPERFTIYIFGDPQPRTSGSGSWTNGSAYKSVDVCNDMYTDMKEYAATMTDRPVYGIGLGDIVHRDVSLLPAYRSGMRGTGITTYNVIGNHDQVNDKGSNATGMTDEESSKAFERIMGPTNYSFNLGNLHFLMLDDMIIRPGGTSDDCQTGLTDDIWQFAKNDLATVPSSAVVMVCAHSPMFRLLEGKDRTGQHLSELRGELSRFERVYAWAGHTHSSFNYYDKNSNLEVHTMGRVTGALWTNEFLSENGTPRGYLVFEYDAGRISWKFKPLFWQTAVHKYAGTDKEPDYKYRDWDYDASGRAILKTGGPLTDGYQMQVFKPDTYAPGDKTVYVNVFLWDEAWKTPTFQMDGSSARSPMTRVTESTGKQQRYSYADWDITAFYAGIWSGLKESWYDNDGKDPSNKLKNCTSIFKYTLNTTEDHGSGMVRVTDRFGNEYTSKVSW